MKILVTQHQISRKIVFSLKWFVMDDEHTLLFISSFS